MSESDRNMEEILELISARHDGELSDAEEARLERLLEEFPEAAREAEAMRSAIDFVQQTGREADRDVRAPEGFRDDVMAKVLAEASSPDGAPVAALSSSDLKQPVEDGPKVSSTATTVIRIVTPLTALAAAAMFMVFVVWPQLDREALAPESDMARRYETATDAESTGEAPADKSGNKSGLVREDGFDETPRHDELEKSGKSFGSLPRPALEKGLDKSLDGGEASLDGMVDRAVAQIQD